MKIAVCLVGQIRSYKECIESQKKVFGVGSENTVDFFIHTWNRNSRAAFNSEDRYQELSESEIDEYFKAYSPKRAVWEDWTKAPFIRDLIDLDSLYKNQGRFECFPYSISKSISECYDYCRITGTYYDYVVWVRPDLKFLGEEVIDWEKIRDDGGEDRYRKVYLLDNKTEGWLDDWDGLCHRDIYIPDFMCIGTPELMFRFKHYYSWTIVREFFGNVEDRRKMITSNYETKLAYFLQEHGVIFSGLPEYLHCDIVRMR